jgi:hypothetical protein
MLIESESIHRLAFFMLGPYETIRIDTDASSFM